MRNNRECQVYHEDAREQKIHTGTFVISEKYFKTLVGDKRTMEGGEVRFRHLKKIYCVNIL